MGVTAHESAEKLTFSPDHGFSRDEVADAASVVATEGPRKRLLINVTMGHRTLARRQAFVSQSIGVFFLVAIYVTERVTPSIARSMLDTWALVAALNVAVRAALFYKVFTPLPVEMAKSVGLRLLPLAIVLIGAAHWIWTIQLFVENELTLTVLVMFAGFLAISVAVMGMWPTVPLAAILYLATTWPPFFVRMYQVGWVPGSVLFFLVLGVVSVLWACAYLEINQVKTILDRSDEVELLLARLHDANAELASANTTLDAMRNEAAAELETRSVFFSSASHDFRQRLHAMKLLAHSAINDAGTSHGSSPPPLKRLADSVEDVEHYITNVLDFARFDRSSLNAERRAVPLHQVFQQLDLTFEDVAAAKKVTLAVRMTGVVLLSDAAMLQRILENLLSNAIKFSSGRVLVAARRRNGGVAIEVWDQGLGIPHEALSEIFTPFYQTSMGLRGQEGVGLGLAVVKRLADCMKYRVIVRSRVGRGTMVAVLVPAGDVHKSDQGEI